MDRHYTDSIDNHGMDAIKKKKLCIITPSHWTAGYGGAEQQVRLFLDELISQDHFDITYVARKVDRKFVPAGYRVDAIRSNWFALKIGYAKFGYVLDTRELLRILNEVRPDVIYQRIGCEYTGIAAYYAKRNDCKMVWHVSSDSNVLPFHLDKKTSRSFVTRYVEKKMLEYGINNSDRIIVQTEWQAHALNKYYRVSSSCLIPNFQPVPNAPRKEKSPIKIIWVANIKPKKQPEIFIKLANEFKSRDDVRFVMVGRCGSSGWYRSILNQIRDSGIIEYLGEISQDEVNARLDESHILVNTSTYEGFPNTFIQAWMREVPVVSLEVDPDNILDKEGLGFCSRNYEAMREQMAALITNEDLRSRMGRRAREYAIRRHSLNNIKEIIKEVST